MKKYKEITFTIDEICDICNSFAKDIQNRENRYKELNASKYGSLTYEAAVNGFEGEKSACFALFCKFTSPDVTKNK